MRRVIANLAPLLTCPAFTLWHLLGAILCVPALWYAWSAEDPTRAGHLAAYILPLWSACVVTSLQRDLLLRPFVFCLPGHRDVPRRTLFAVGIVVSLVAALPVFDYGHLEGLGRLGALWSAFCFGLSAYLLVVGALFVVPNVAIMVGPIVGIVFVLVEFPDTGLLVQDAALFAPGWNSAILALLSVLAWRKLGSAALHRRSCGGYFLSLQMAWRRSAAEEFGERGRLHVLSKGTWGVRRWILQRSFERIGRRPVLSLRRHLAATQYQLKGHLVPLTPWTVSIVGLVVLGGVVAAGYAPPREERPDVPVANALYVGSCVIALHMLLPVFAPMLLTAGRRERFWSALAIAAQGGLAVAAISILTYVTYRGMWLALPPLSLGGTVYPFRPADLEPAFVPLVVMPFSLVLKIVCTKWLFVPELVLLGFAVVILVPGGAALKEIDLLAVAVLLLASWGVFVAVLGFYCYHGDLVRE